MKFKGYSLKLALGALALGVAFLLGGSETAYAQGRGLRQHQRLERYYYGNSRTLRDHQRRERFGYYNNRRFYGPYNRGYYNYGRFNRGYYGNRFGFGFGRGWGHQRYRGW
jgi:hypothetical protein